MKRILSILLVLLFAFQTAVPGLAAEQAAGTTIRLGETSGTVTVASGTGQAQTVRKDMRLYNGYTVSTGADSSAYISLDGTKAVKLDASSKAELRQSGTKLEVCLLAGNLFFNVTQPLRADESLNIRTSTMVTGIRGSFGWVRPGEMGLMHGHATVRCFDSAAGAAAVLDVKSGQGVRLTGDAAGSGYATFDLTNSDVPAIVREELAADPALRAQIAQDVPALDAAALASGAAESRAQESARESAVQSELDALAAEQTAELSGGRREQVFEESASSGSGTGSGGNADDGDDADGGEITYAVTFTDGVNGEEIFPDKTYSGLRIGDPTPSYDVVDPEREGYWFMGWSPDFTDTVTGNTTYTAKWEIKHVSITFMVDSVYYDSASVEWGSVPASIDPPEEQGKEFFGWYLEDGVTQFTFKEPLYDDVTVYGSLIDKQCTVTFMVGDAEYGSQTVDYGEMLKPVEDPVQGNDRFLGWYLSGSDTPFDFSEEITDSFALYARFDTDNSGSDPQP